MIMPEAGGDEGVGDWKRDRHPSVQPTGKLRAGSFARDDSNSFVIARESALADDRGNLVSE